MINSGVSFDHVATKIIRNHVADDLGNVYLDDGQPLNVLNIGDVDINQSHQCGTCAESDTSHNRRKT